MLEWIGIVNVADIRHGFNRKPSSPSTMRPAGAEDWIQSSSASCVEENKSSLSSHDLTSSDSKIVMLVRVPACFGVLSAVTENEEVELIYS